MSWLKKSSTKDIVACLATANLYFLHVWHILLVPARQYHLGILPGPLDFAIVLTDILAISLAMYGCLVLARRYMGNPGASVTITVYLFLLLALTVTAYRPRTGGVFDFAHLNHTQEALVLAGCSLTLLAVRRPVVMPRIFHLVGMILIPCTFLLVFESIEYLLVRRVQAEPAVHPADGKNPAEKFARTTLIIFDMLDYDLLFDHKPPNMQLSEFDRLRSESLFAQKATSPNEFTIHAIPSLTTGAIVRDAEPISTDDLLLTFEGSPKKKRWKLQPTILSEARDAGMTTGWVGWYHPYCRLFSDMLTSCEWVPWLEKFLDRGSTLSGVERAIAEVISEDLFGPDPPHIVKSILKVDQNMRRKYIDSYQRLLTAAKKALTDPGINFVVLHLPVPHFPTIYNRSTQQFSTENGDYMDNVALADRTLGELRREMEHAGLWETTNILITADHGYRLVGPPEWKHTPTPYHVPFFLKISGFDRHLEDDQPFNTIRIHDLLLALLEGQVATPEQAKGWLHSAPPVRYQHPKQITSNSR